MFTGLIEETGVVRQVAANGDGIDISVECSRVIEDAKTGDSIAVNGACQTVTSLGKGFFTVFASSVTAQVTTLGSFKKGDRVNLERAMTPASRFGGHIVQGHVDGKGRIRKILKDRSGITIDVDTEPGIMNYIVSKGSVTVDGISLTVVNAGDTVFSLYIIPETISGTTIDNWKTGTEVNLEVDILAKYVEKMLSRKESGNEESLKSALAENGFL